MVRKISKVVMFCILALAVPVMRADAVALSVWDWSGWRAELIQEMANEYMAEHAGVTIEVQTVAGYWDKLPVAVAAGTAPDVAYFHNNRSTQLLEALEPLPETLFPPEELDQVYYQFQESFFIDGRAYFLPTGVMAALIFYNKDLWNEAGLGAPPTTWEEFRNDANKLARRGADGSLSTGGFELEPGAVVDIWRDLNYQFGGWMFDSGARGVTWDTEPGRSALNLIDQMIFTDGTIPIPSRDGRLPFLEGQSAMHYHWAYWRSQADRSDIDYGVFPLPTVTGLPTPARGANNYEAGLAVLKGAPADHKEAAFRFLRWLLDSEEFQLRLNVDGGRIPGMKRLWSDPRVRQDEVMTALADEVPHTVFLGEFPVRVRGVLTRMGNDLFARAQSPAALLEEAQRQGDIIMQESPPAYYVERSYQPGGM